jgi:predicted acetyltransferase
MVSIELLKPSRAILDAYVQALKRGWAPETVMPDAAERQLHAIAEDAEAFIRKLDDPEAKSGPILLPGGSTVPRLPGITRWIWDGEFCGRIGFRWKPGTEELPPTCLGHIGYAVVPWKQRRGYATRAVALMLNEARAVGLACVHIVADVENVPSQKVILASGGRLAGQFTKEPQLGGGQAMRFRIDL